MRRTYGEISHYRAPYKNSVLSGFGAEAAAEESPNEPFSEQGAAARKQLLDGMLAAREEKPSTGGMLRIKKQYQLDILKSAVMAAGRVYVSQNKPKLVSIVPKKTEFGGYSPTDKDPNMLKVLAYWSGRSMRPAGYSKSALPSSKGGVSAGDFKWIYVTPMALGDSAVPVFVLSNEAIDATACGDMFRSVGAAGCELFELMGPQDALPAELVSLIGKTEMSTASMLGYAALGVAVAAGALAIVARRRPKAQANRSRRRRR